MNIAVLILLGIALLLQIIALVLVAMPSLKPSSQVDGAYEADANAGARRLGTILAIVGVILATVGSGLSLWAPGF